jgi:hypothetical protein
VTTWRHFAKRELPRVIRELGLPAAEPIRATGMHRCPRHQAEIGPTTRTCLACHDELWEEIARRYRDQGRPVDPHDRPPLPPLQGGAMSTELAPLPDPEPIEPAVPATLFGTSDPRVAIEKMSDLARLLVDVVRDRKLVTRISGKDYLLAPGWAVLGGMTGIVPYTVWTKPTDEGDGWLVRVEARRVVDGMPVGAAEQICRRSEPRWSKAADHALLGMAQTRAASRALRAPLMQVVELAGYEPTPAEEISESAVVIDAPKRESPVAPAQATREQLDEISSLLDRLAELDPDTDWRERAQELAGVPARMLTKGGANLLLDKLRDELARLDDEAAA